MTLRTKLSAALSAGITVALLVSTALLLRLEKRSIRAAEMEKADFIIESAVQMAREAERADDPLMLADWLSALRDEHREVRGIRMRFKGTWQEVAGRPKPEQAGAPLTRATEVKGPRGEGVGLEFQFEPAVIAERERAAFLNLVRNTAAAGGVAALFALLASYLLAGRMTERIVRIEGVVAAVAGGRFDAAGEDEGGTDELAQLARGVGVMARRLRELDAVKRTFTASVTHELRSPLAAIQSNIRRLLDGRTMPGETPQDILRRTERQAARLEHFVTNLLEMAKIERGKLDFHPRPSRLDELVTDAVKFFVPHAEEKGLILTARCEEGLPETVLDPELVTQVLTNLLSNAIKFTPKGGRVTVAASRAPGSGPPALECSVTDTGVGIRIEDLKHLFEPFERGAGRPGAPGTGLGLSISRSIARMHGGDITADSALGQGSRFVMSLPLKAAVQGASMT